MTSPSSSSSSNDTITNDVDRDMEVDQEEEGEMEERKKSLQLKESKFKRKKTGNQEFKQDNKNTSKRLRSKSVTNSSNIESNDNCKKQTSLLNDQSDYKLGREWLRQLLKEKKARQSAK